MRHRCLASRQIGHGGDNNNNKKRRQQEGVQDARRELFIDSIDWVHPSAAAPYGASFMFNETYLPAPPIEIEHRRAPGKRSHHSPRHYQLRLRVRVGHVIIAPGAGDKPAFPFFLDRFHTFLDHVQPLCPLSIKQ